MPHSNYILGHYRTPDRINVKKELRRISENPLMPLLRVIDGDHHNKIVSDDRTRYADAYWFYFLSIQRYLKEMSVAARYKVVRSNGSSKYTDSQRKLARQYRNFAEYLELDLLNCLIYARILLDRVIALSRYFLSGNNMPGFTSFNDHKNFFIRLKDSYGLHESYADYLRTNTDWFDMPLKTVRDKFIVHAAPKHMRFMGFPDDGYHLDLNIILPDSEDNHKPFSKVKLIKVNVVRMTYQIEEFLKWFCAYGMKRIDKKTPNHALHVNECHRTLFRQVFGLRFPNRFHAL